MKKLDVFKTVQLVLFVGLTSFCAYKLLRNPAIYQMIASDPNMKIFFTLLWGVLGISYIFLLLDFCLFSSFKKDYHELDLSLRSDPLSGIPNRFSCDALIEKYIEQPVPENMCCMMLELSNIYDINKLYGHAQGNAAIKDFSLILQMASLNLCFVGRNGGNKFMALFEDATQEKMDTFLERVNTKINAHNANPNTHPITFRCGIAYREGRDINSITELISLANSRIYAGEED